MLFKATVSQSSTLLMMRSSRTNSMPLKKAQLRLKSEKLKAGCQATLKLTLLSMKENSRLLKMFSIPSCKRSTPKVELPLELADSLVALVDSQEVLDSLEELDSQEVHLAKEDHQAQVSIKSIDYESCI